MICFGIEPDSLTMLEGKIMNRRNQKRFSSRDKRYRSSDQKLVKKLNLRKLEYFRYEAKEIFLATDLEEKVWNPLLASIVTKASRMSIKDADDYINKLEEDDVLSIETAKSLIYLLERYKRWR